METYIKGNFRKSIFQSESGYYIGIFKVKETNDEELIDYIDRTITFTGYFHELNEEDTYLFYGNIVQHEKYGEQFQVTKYERVMPEEKDSIVEFLAGGLFKGIGKKTAQKIVDVLGKDTLNIILENPENLLLIPGITNKLIDSLHTQLLDYQSSYRTLLALSEYGFTTKESMSIYHHYQESALSKLEENIYQIVLDIHDFSFRRVDAIALRKEIAKDDPRRIQAAILYVMNELCNLYGHSYLLQEEIAVYLMKVLGVRITEEEYLNALSFLQTDTLIVVREEKYYLKEMYEAEKNIAARVRYLSHLAEEKPRKLSTLLKNLEEKMEINYNEDQKIAIQSCFQKHFLIITGGPGTGKTTIVKAIVELFQMFYGYSHEQASDKIALLAPTGRAAKRINESTLFPALTIHRFLKWNKDLDRFAINEYNKSEVEWVVVDEASMVDTYLMDHLLKGLSFNTKIILIGDDNQLPSVGPGEVLKDLIAACPASVVFLKHLYRQGKDSSIITLAHDMMEDRVDKSMFEGKKDLSFERCDSMVLKERLIDLCMKYKDTNYKKFQILAPMYKTMNGIDELNVVLQKILNPKSLMKKEITVNGVLYREEDKVIQLTNMPDDNVFNGDIGIIQQITNGTKKEIVIDFDGNLVKYTPSQFHNFKHAFVISIHKSQGSEFDTVIMPILKSYHKMLYRKLIYTGVTRSKKELYLLGEMDAFFYAVHNHQDNMRRTTLKDMIVRIS